MTGGRNASVTSISTTDAGVVTVIVHYPDIPAGPGTPPDPPAQAAHDETLDDVSEAWASEFKRVQSSKDELVVTITPGSVGPPAVAPTITVKKP